MFAFVLQADDRISKKLSLKETHQHTQALKSEITLKREAKCERIKGRAGVTREKMKHTYLTQVGSLWNPLDSDSQWQNINSMTWFKKWFIQ